MVKTSWTDSIRSNILHFGHSSYADIFLRSARKAFFRNFEVMQELKFISYVQKALPRIHNILTLYKWTILLGRTIGQLIHVAAQNWSYKRNIR